MGLSLNKKISSLLNDEFPVVPLSKTDVRWQAMYPSTRYQGSKRKLVDWIWGHLKGLPFDTALDGFGGTGSVSLLFKKNGKSVHFNDRLRWNAINAEAFLLNSGVRLARERAEELVAAADANRTPGFISNTFRDIYFTEDENLWLDGILPAIHGWDSRFERALAFHALFQACLAKRPYNLFHRKNLTVRTADVARTFGNKTTWDTSFPVHFLRFVEEANACVFDNGRSHRVSCEDVQTLSAGADLVYLDPPYTSVKGVSVDYHQFYHFLEGLAQPETWASRIDFKSKHLRMRPEANPWVERKSVADAFERLFEQHRDSILVVSYRSSGIPSIEDLARSLKKFKRDVRIERRENYRYALSSSPNAEVLLIGT